MATQGCSDVGDIVLPGDDPWSLSRYAYVAGNPLIRLDPTGHCWVVCAIVHAVTHAVKAAVKVVAVVADTTLGISSMISDVKIIFSGKTNFFQKVLAVGDLSLNAFMDVTTVIGVGEGLRALGKGLVNEGVGQLARTIPASAKYPPNENHRMADEAAMARAEPMRKAQPREDVNRRERRARTSAQALMAAAVAQRPFPGAISAPGSERASATAIAGGGR